MASQAYDRDRGNVPGFGVFHWGLLKSAIESVGNTHACSSPIPDHIWAKLSISAIREICLACDDFTCPTKGQI
ncbi:MAG: hypothetical protein ACXAEI_16080 [Candidatus Hodarchaeales archaeon]